MSLRSVNFDYSEQASLADVNGFLGNSMVWRGFDPQAFAQAYQAQRGQALRCFNFGVDAMPAAGAGAGPAPPGAGFPRPA